MTHLHCFFFFLHEGCIPSCSLFWLYILLGMAKIINPLDYHNTVMQSSGSDSSPCWYNIQGMNLPRKQQFIRSLIRAMLHSLGIRQTVDGGSDTCCLLAQRYGKCENAAFVYSKLIKMDSMTCCVRTEAVRVTSNSCLMSDSLQYF